MMKEMTMMMMMMMMNEQKTNVKELHEKRNKDAITTMTIKT